MSRRPTRPLLSRSGLPLLLATALTLAPAALAGEAPGPRFESFGAVDPERTRAFAVVLIDLDGDRDLDLVLGRGGHFPAANAIHLNQGAGVFGPARVFGDDSATFTLASADVDGDGSPDVLVGNALANTSEVFRGDGHGGLARLGSIGAQGIETRWMGVADADGDGDLDVVMVNKASVQYHYLSATNTLELNDGSGHFFGQRPIGAGSDFTIDADLGDVDGDGDVDVVVANDRKARSALHRNDGAGHFDAGRWLGPRYLNTRAIALGDVDGDGDLDVVLGTWGGANRVLLNDSQGTFRPAQHPFGAADASTRDLALADLDGDGDLDVVEAAVGQQDRVHWNDGRGRFPTSTSLGSATSHTWSVAVGDVDGDGAPDVAVARSDEPSGVYLNRASR